MQGEKTVPRKQYAVAFVIVGVVLAILGAIFNFALDASKTFDLPWFVLGIGVIAIVYGIVQMTRGQRLHPEVSFSARSAKNFLTNNAIMLALLALVVVICFIEPRFMQIQVLLDILTQSPCCRRLPMRTGSIRIFRSCRYSCRLLWQSSPACCLVL